MATPTSTHLATFNDGVSTLLTTSVLTPLSTWLAANKNCQCSVEELMTALKVTAPTKPVGFPQAGNVPVQMPNIPGFAANSAPSRAKRGQAATHTGPTCRYQFARGLKRGQLCGESCVETAPGQYADFCRSCIKKKAAQNNVGGNPTAPQGNSTNLSGQGEITVVPLKDKPGYFKSTGTNFIIRRLDDGAVIAVGVEESDGTTRPLNASEKEMADKMGVGVQVDDSETPEEKEKEEKEESPSVKNTPNVPKVPNLGGLQVGIPALPQAKAK